MADPIIGAAVSSLISALLTQFIEWQKQRAQVAGWKPSQQDVADFLAQVEADSPETVKARVAAALGIPWPPVPPA